MVAKVSMSTLMFVIGNYFIRSFNNFRKLMIYYFIFYLFLLATIFFSNISGIGHIDYDESENAFLYGGVGVSMTGIIMLVLILVPQVSIILKSKIYRYFIIGLFIVGLLLVVISTKRSALLGLFTSVLTFLLLYKRRFMLLLPLLTITLILYIFHPVYKDVLIRSYETRETSFYGISENAGDIEEEARYNETSLVINSFKSDNIIHKLFGSELFNEFEYFKTERMLHIDFNVLLNGAGIFGLFLLFRIYFLIVIKALSYRRIFKNRFLHLVAISIIIYVVLAQFVSIGGSIRSIDFRGLLFLYIGSALGFLENEYKRIKINHVAH
ncbi:MAG: hypothetical protein JXB49_25200 [Bacteroidales bacterium]|nr:hypothetical protein [Bacteroidales bacterium]